MADSNQSGSILDSGIALAVMIGGLLMTAFAVARSLLTSGRDAREALATSKKHEAEIVDLKRIQGEDRLTIKHINDSLNEIKEQLRDALRGGGRHRG